MGYSAIIPNLFQGSQPPIGVDYARFDVIVLCANSYQPSAEQLGVAVIHAPFDDAERLTKSELQIAWRAGNDVSRALRKDKRVLVTCRQGRNRSGLVSAFALMNLGYSADDAIKLVKAARTNALTNTHFTSLIRARGRATTMEEAHAS